MKPEEREEPRRRGRPPGTGDGVDQPVTVMLTEREKYVLASNAAMAGRTVSAYVRELIRKDKG